MNLTGRPIIQKNPPPLRSKKHLDRVRELPCVICLQHGPEPGCGGRSHAHHVKSGRYGQTKAGDDETIPLCWFHHQGPGGFHTAQETWERKYGADHTFIPLVRDMLAGEFTWP